MPETKEDELAGTEQPFVAHLMELRDRLIKATIAIAVCAGIGCATIHRFSARLIGPNRACASNSPGIEGKRKAVRCGSPSGPWI